MTSNVDDVNPPRSMQNVVQMVTEWVINHAPHTDSGMVSPPTEFRYYDDALGVVWPELYKTSKEAHLLVAVSVYVDIAERWGFDVPPEIKAMIL